MQKEEMGKLLEAPRAGDSMEIKKDLRFKDLPTLVRRLALAARGQQRAVRTLARASQMLKT
jgi:hypothetical protein